MSKAHKPKPVAVIWEDSCSPSSGYWRHLDEWDASPSTITTLGFIVKKRKRYIVVAASISDDGVAPGGQIAIPRRAIKQIRRG